jgi:hypothetical protein
MVMEIKDAQIVISIAEFENTDKQFVPETRIQATTTKMDQSGCK